MGEWKYLLSSQKQTDLTISNCSRGPEDVTENHKFTMTEKDLWLERQLVTEMFGVLTYNMIIAWASEIYFNSTVTGL